MAKDLEQIPGVSAAFATILVNAKKLQSLDEIQAGVAEILRRLDERDAAQIVAKTFAECKRSGNPLDNSHYVDFSKVADLAQAGATIQQETLEGALNSLRSSANDLRIKTSYNPNPNESAEGLKLEVASLTTMIVAGLEHGTIRPDQQVTISDFGKKSMTVAEYARQYNLPDITNAAEAATRQQAPAATVPHDHDGAMS